MHEQLRQVRSDSRGCILSHHKVKYKEEGKKELSVNLFSLLPDTIDQQHAKELRDLQSEVCSISVSYTGDSHLQTLHHVGIY